VDPVAAITHAPYYYANDNPVNAEDPTGLAAVGFCETLAEHLERLERLERLREQVDLENAEERRAIIIEEYEEISIAWGKGFVFGVVCFPLKYVAGVCEALAEPPPAS
jgi:hypothetical protein